MVFKIFYVFYPLHLFLLCPTPINAIMGIAELELKNQKNSIDQEDHFKVIRNASLSLLSNVNDILDFEKIEKNELQLKTERFNPSDAISKIAENWKSEAENKGLIFFTEVDEDLPILTQGDPERFMQIINNVLSNAVKFTEEGEINLKVKSSNLPNSMSRLSIQVSDTGVGMDEEGKNSVFDSFNQMRLNHNRKFGGIGLGLTIVRHLVELFEGSIEIESQLNNGTTVYVEIPLQSIAVENKQKSITNKFNIAPKVLVVEDNKLNQMVMKKMLSSHPEVDFSIANHGEEAVEFLKNEYFDMILMDLQMPVMDGYEATKLIRSGHLGNSVCDIPIIAVTADATEATRQKVLALGMNDYITKPVQRDLLFDKMKGCQNLVKLKIA
ncbi:ATP-binding protein [Psychroserpens sp. XS_ASV72]|uniref:ATP-binding protein n=1 Tax=Psychroserpens sp. XS_ASV72 TaxID=3241293 RepID=UPI003512C627